MKIITISTYLTLLMCLATLSNCGIVPSLTSDGVRINEAVRLSSNGKGNRIPAAPAALSAKAVSPTQIDITWTDHSNNETGFEVERSQDNVSFALIASTGANVTSYSSVNLQSATTYYFRVRAFNKNGKSAYSEVASATTTITAAPPAAPTNLVAGASSSTQIDLTWLDHSTNESGFQIERFTGSQGFSLIATVASDIVEYSDVGLAAGTTYTYRVRAYNLVGPSSYSNTVTMATPPLSQIPSAPSQLAGRAVSASQIELTWIDNTNDETGFKIERSTDNANFQQIAQLSPNAISFSDAGLTASTLYYYRVRAFNAVGDSASSNVAQATTLAGGTGKRCTDLGRPECIEITSCQTLSRAGTYYLLRNDVRADRGCFPVTESNITLDLNGFAVTYSDMAFQGVNNPGFEQADTTNPAAPAGWDLTNAPNARWNTPSQQLFYGLRSLQLSNPAGDAHAEEWVLSSPVNLPSAGRYAVFTSIKGSPYNKVKAWVTVEGLSVTCQNTSSNMGSAYQGTDMSIGIICEFSIAAPTTVRAKIVLGTVDPAASTTIAIDEADIRPVGDVGIGASGWNKTNFSLLNGKVFQGNAQSVYSPAVLTWQGGSFLDLTIITNGMNSSNISGLWNSGITIARNHLEMNSKNPLHRHYPASMLNFERSAGGLSIHDNVLMNGPHVGIFLGNATSGQINPQKTEIYNNTIKMRVVATNGFSIVAGSNVDIHDNVIQPIQGHGVGVGTGSHNTRIFNNRIEPRTWPCSEYSAYTYPNAAHGIRIKTYGSGNLSNLEIFGNTIVGKTNPQLSNCYTEVSGITNYLYDSDLVTAPNPSGNRIHHNDISVETDNYLQQHAMAFKHSGNGFAEVSHNTFKSNHIVVEMSDGDSNGGSNTRFVSNTLVKASNPNGFRTMRYGYFMGTGNIFLDTILSGGASLTDVYQTRNYSSPIDFTVAWYLRVLVLDSAGLPVDGATIRAFDKSSILTKAQSTGADGRSTLELSEYKYQYASSVQTTYYAPYQIEVSKAGFPSQVRSVTLSNSTDLTVILAP